MQANSDLIQPFGHGRISHRKFLVIAKSNCSDGVDRDRDRDRDHDDFLTMTVTVTMMTF